MKALVVYFSRTGNARKTAESIVSRLKCDSEEIVLKVSRAGPIGFIICGMESARRKSAPIQPPKKDPSGYDIVIIGGPIWASNMSSPVRAYLSMQGKSIKEAAFFCTMGSNSSGKAFSDMAVYTGKQPTATLAISQGEIKDGSYEKR